MPDPSTPPRIAIVYQGDPHHPGSWSGIPAGLAAGFEAVGAVPVPVDARAPASDSIARALRLPWTARSTSSLLAAAGGARASVSLRNSRLDGAVAIGSGYVLRGEVPVVTFDDMTVAQALALPESDYEGIERRAAGRWRERQRRAYVRSRACCVASEWAAASVIDDYGIEPAKVHVVGFGHNVPRQVVDRDWTRPRFLFIGIDWERKRGAAVVEAFSQVRAQHPEATLDLIGGHPPIEAPGVEAHGLLPLGSEEGARLIAALLARATCLVMPSRLEAFGIAYVDAAASGVPSIGTSHGGAATAIGDGGLLVAPDEQGALLNAMLTMCDPTTVSRLGGRAFLRSDGFTWKAVGERVLAALNRSAAQHR